MTVLTTEDMRREHIDIAIAEAERFIKRAKKAKGNVSIYPNPEIAAMKRTSMDLSRALSVLRKSPYAIYDDWRKEKEDAGK